MAISLNLMTDAVEGACSRAETQRMLEVVIKRQMQQLAGTVKDTASYNSAAHYPSNVAEIEHICRLLWGVVPAGESLEYVHEHLRQQIIAGSTPTSSAFWQYPTHYDQRVVEMSAIAVALIDANAHYWLPLNEQERENLTTWLLSVTDLELPPNNWRWFRILILKALELLDVEINQSVLANDLEFVDELYLSDGWYQDGHTGVLDYYNPFAFQLYALMFVRWSNEESALCQRLMSRAIEFSKSYQYWIAEDGKPLCYGRSLNYRFAGAAFWSELARSGNKLVDIAVARTCWQRTMCWWNEQPIWDNNGQLLPGFAYPNLLASEFYTSYASPMLAMKAFNALALDAEHPFWQASIVPLNDTVEPIRMDHHLLLRRGGVYMLTNGPACAELRHCYDKYSKFAYSSDHGLCVESHQWLDQGWAGDNMLALRHPQTGQWMTRTRNLETQVADDYLVSIWQPFPGCQVKTTQRFSNHREVRLNQIICDEPLDFVLTGHAVDRWSKWFSHEETRPARVESDELFSELVLLSGPGVPRVYPCAPNTNLLFPHASVPAITGQFPEGSSNLLVEVCAGKNESTFNNDHIRE